MIQKETQKVKIKKTATDRYFLVGIRKAYRKQIVRQAKIEDKNIGRFLEYCFDFYLSNQEAKK